LKLPLLSAQELCRFLEKEGFHMDRQNGSHRFFKHPDGRATVVPVHSNRDVKRGLLHVILKDIKLSREEFFKKYA